MKCPSCNVSVPETAKFCSDCGAPLPRACPACGHGNPASAKFCAECGAQLAPAPALLSSANGGGLARGQPRFASAKNYTPKHLAKKILISRAALEGERKQVTVLFADLKGSMELIAERDPEEARAILEPVLERMVEAVHHYEGTVNLVMGDGIMALFGAPVAHEDHAVRACYAALRMQEAIRRFTGELRHSHGVEVQIRVGLNSGAVVVGAIGSDLQMDYTAVGQTTHLAARMEQLAAPGTVRLTADTLRLAEGYIAVKPLGPMPVKGRAASGRGLRAHRRRRVAWSPARRAGARTDPFRRPAKRNRADAECARPGARGTRPDYRGRGRAGRRQIAPVLRVRALPPYGWLAGRRGKFGLLRQGDALSAADRPAQGVFQDRSA